MFTANKDDDYFSLILNTSDDENFPLVALKISSHKRNLIFTPHEVES